MRIWIPNPLLLCASALLVINALARIAQGQEGEDVTSTPGVDDPGLYQGDILLTEEQQATLEATANPNDPYSPQHAAVVDRRFKWRGAVVPYVLDDSLTQKAINAIREAIAEFDRKSCVRFVPRTSPKQTDYVLFIRGRGCFSYVGRAGGSQEISIGRGCQSKGIVMHEMFHALGRWHEHSRPDRDQHIEICTDNILPGTERNFQTVHPLLVTTYGIPYDLDSIMHYGAYAFSYNEQPTIKPRNSSIPLARLGQRRGFSEKDLMHINALYCEGEISTVTWTPWSSWSSCTRTCNGGTRTRTRSCSGGSSCEGSNFDSDRCNTDACPVPPTWGQWTNWSGCSTTCGRGRQMQIRQCQDGNSCVGKNTKFRDCNRGSCPQPTWSTWGHWSPCSSTCEGGTRTRIRTCLHGNNCSGISLVVESCNRGVPCVIHISFEHVGCYKVPARSLRLLEGQGGLTDDPFTRTRPILKCGQTALKLGYTVFAVSMGYCLSGSSNVNHYKRFPANACRRGLGGYYLGVFLMDVYAVSEIEQPVQNPVPANCETESSLQVLEGIQSVGCYSVSKLTLSIESLEGLSDYLSGDPTQRTDAVLMCGKAASELGYTVFGVSMGYCISGSNNTLDYQREPAHACRNGTGGYDGGLVLMNVYHLTQGERESNTLPSLTHSVRKRDAVEVKPVTDEVMETSPEFVAEVAASGEYMSSGAPLSPLIFLSFILLSLALPF